MPLTRTIICWVAIFFCLPASGQKKHVADTLELRRWDFSFNSMALLEPANALAIGVGYHVNSKVDVWTESSYFIHSASDQGVRGRIRQILQVRYFLSDQPHFFVGIDARYKSLINHEQHGFYNTSLQDTLYSHNSRATHEMFGMAFLAGVRYGDRGSHWQVEITWGLGYKNTCNTYQRLPEVNTSQNIRYSIKMDNPFPDFLAFSGLYIPCTARIVYTFGKTL